MTSKVITKKDKKWIHGLYLVTDRELCIHHDLIHVIEKSIRGGVSMVQLREKSISTREFLELARVIKKILQDKNIPLIINDRVDIAQAVEAEGVHLGQSDMPVDLARQILGEEAIIGISIEEIEELSKIPKAANIDYIGVSPIYATPTKKDTKAAWGLEGLKKIRQLTEIPLVAIGGIHAENAENILAAGADSLAVVSYLCSSENPEESARQILKFFK